MGMVHRMVVDACSDYFSQMRRRVYQTPRSFLAFLSSYKVSPATGDSATLSQGTKNAWRGGEGHIRREEGYSDPSSPRGRAVSSAVPGCSSSCSTKDVRLAGRRLRTLADLLTRYRPREMFWGVTLPGMRRYNSTSEHPGRVGLRFVPPALRTSRAQDLYLNKKKEVDVKSQRVMVGLEKLAKGADDVETMKARVRASRSVDQSVGYPWTGPRRTSRPRRCLVKDDLDEGRISFGVPVERRFVSTIAFFAPQHGCREPYVPLQVVVSAAPLFR